MKTIEIDDDVFAYLQSKAIAFVETPNLTLRRLLGIEKRERLQSSNSRAAGRKKRKTDLAELVSAGLIQEGQRLFLRNYRKQEIPGYEAVVSNGKLRWSGQTYSMSELAKIMLKENGYESDSVRGPMFWYTEDGLSIKDIWGRYQKSA